MHNAVPIATARRVHDAAEVNRIANHPGVRPYIDSTGDGAVDLTKVCADPHNFVFVGEHGYAVFASVMIGSYEVHSASAPEGRGAWTLSFAKSCLDAIFTQSTAWEVLTRIPTGNVPASALARSCGYREEFAGMSDVVYAGQIFPVKVWRLSVHDWVARSERFLTVGEWLHRRLHEEAERLGIDDPPHAPNEYHSRVAGAALDMARAGNAIKATFLYARWSALARHGSVSLVSADPPMLRMDIGLLRLKGDDIEVVRDENSL
jgi:hypothetical protein